VSELPSGPFGAQTARDDQRFDGRLETRHRWASDHTGVSTKALPFRAARIKLDDASPNQRLKGAAILVLRASTFFQAAPGSLTLLANCGPLFVPPQPATEPDTGKHFFKCRFGPAPFDLVVG
jgi:hypothetical protein